MSGVRTTDLGVASYRRLIYRNVIQALRDAFDANYDREPQFAELKITQKYPLQKIDYPCIVVEYQDQRVVNAGVGHVEWFPDPLGRLRKWNHSRFEGSLNFQIHALSTLDRDILADALVEIIRFGRLDPQLNRFYEVLYPEHTPPAWDSGAADPNPFYEYNYSLFGQLMFDSDQVMGQGNSATVAPWQPEDVLVYSTGYSCVLHGGYYNSYPTVDWSKVSSIIIDAYQTDQYDNELPFPGHAEVAWTPAWLHEDEGEIAGTAVITGVEEYDDGPREYWDSDWVQGGSVITSAEEFEDV